MIVTIAAAYGAGGSQVAPALAQALGVPLLDRPLVSDEADEPNQRRLLSRLGSLATAWGTPAGLSTEELLPDDAQRREFEREVKAFAAGGSGVILGRAATRLLRKDPRALHVLLDGPREARLEQAMAIQGIDRQTAERRLERTDRFRHAYVALYGIDVREPGAFHLVLDSTSIPLEDCVKLIAAAALMREDRLRAGGDLDPPAA